MGKPFKKSDALIGNKQMALAEVQNAIQNNMLTKTRSMSQRQVALAA